MIAIKKLRKIWKGQQLMPAVSPINKRPSKKDKLLKHNKSLFEGHLTYAK
ncbi:MAG: hypothetical protein ACYSWR_02030 [Planctomycetota bacterium]